MLMLSTVIVIEQGNVGKEIIITDLSKFYPIRMEDVYAVKTCSNEFNDLILLLTDLSFNSSPQIFPSIFSAVIRW